MVPKNGQGGSQQRSAWLCYTGIFNRYIGLKFYERRYILTKKYIKKRFYSYLKINKKKEITNIEKNSPIWICWWQGEDNAPDLVKKCINSIRKNSKNHPIVVISEDNYYKYIEIPKKIIENVESKTYSVTHLSDLIRLKLLSKYGGIWCDATIFMSDKISEEIYNYPFFTIKHDFKYILSLEIEPSQCRWRSFFMASGKGNYYFETAADILSKWMESGVPLIDYFTIDYIIWVLAEENDAFAKMISNVPQNNNGPYRLAKLLNEKYDLSIWKNIKNENYLHKLNYRINILNLDDSFYFKIVQSENII